MKKYIPLLLAIASVLMLAACIISCFSGASALLHIGETEDLAVEDLYALYIYPFILFACSSIGFICSYCLTHWEISKVTYTIFRFLMYLFLVICALSFLLGFFAA